jgi:hypothetical protein
MNTSEIQSLLQKLNKKYGSQHEVGVFASDKIAYKKCSLPSALICNYDTSYQPGSHWIAIYLSKQGNVHYFDSYAMKPPVDGILRFMKQNAHKKIQYNTVHMQDIFSKVCGEYCILFLSTMMQHKRMKDFQTLFNNKNKMKNDLAVKQAFKHVVKSLKRQRHAPRTTCKQTTDCVQCSVAKNAWNFNSKCL